MTTERYIIECSHRQPGTRLLSFETFPMGPERAACRRNVVEDICRGEIENVSRVWFASTDEPLRDVTADIAGECIDQLRADRADRVCGQLRDFLEEHLGVHAPERLLGIRCD